MYFLIKKATLTNGTKHLKPLYTDSFDESGRVCTVTFPTQNADINEGVLDINDEYLKSFEVKRNDDGTTSLIFTGRLKNSYLVYTRDSGDTAITVIRPATGRQRPVVIDPGHGGTAPGAVYGDLYEKDLNLDIARRLEALLKEKGIKTYMIRTDDSNVDNYERAYIANMLGAELYLSIHNNATNSKECEGHHDSLLSFDQKWIHRQGLCPDNPERTGFNTEDGGLECAIKVRPYSAEGNHHACSPG